MEKNELSFKGELLTSKKYWTENLEGFNNKTNIPINFNKCSGERLLKKSEFKIENENFQKLMKTSGKSDINLSIMLLSVINIILNKYTELNDVLIGVPILKQKKIGEFINVELPLRNILRDDENMKQLIIEVKKSFVNANKNSNYSIDKVVYNLGLFEDEEEENLYDTLFVLDNIHETNFLEETKSEMIFYFKKEEDCIQGEIRYNANLYKESSVKRLISYFNYVLERYFFNFDTKIGEIDLALESEKEFVLYKVNNTGRDYQKEKVITSLIEETAMKNGDKCALICNEEKITYQELNTRANNLAYKIQQVNSENKLVGIFLERSIECIVAMLGVLKAGKAYVPIDIDSPMERIDNIIGDSKVDILISRTDYMSKVKYENNFIDIKDIDNETVEKVETPNNLNDVAYVIYTSGTTGEAKGTLIKHESLLNYIQWFMEKGTVTKDDRAGIITSFSFDLGYTTLFSSLVSGACLYIMNKELLFTPNKLVNYLVESKVSYLKITPSIFNVIINADNYTLLKDSNLRLVLVGGEKIDLSDVKKLYDITDKIKVINHYGPTETTIGAITKDILAENVEDIEGRSIIGKPISNTNVYILNKSLKLVPRDVEGEIYISGKGVSRGYLNKDNLTKLRFIDNPFDDGYDKLYKTGDLARYTENGDIEFLGRSDRQVKVRGYRVELEDVENHILSRPYIEEAVVLSKEEKNENYLVSYVTVNKKITKEKIRKDLELNMLNYMVPSFITILDEMPVNENGKVDYKKLANQKVSMQFDDIIPAETDLQKLLVDIWTKELGIENEIGINTSFFDLGGNSLKAIKIIAEIQREIDVEIPIVEFFLKPAIEQLAMIIENMQKEYVSNHKTITKAPASEYYSLSSVQKRMYFLNQLNKESTSYNVPYFWELNGEIEKDKIKSILNKLIERHEAFRTSFYDVDGEVKQKINENVSLKLDYKEVEEDSVPKLIEEFVKPFDLSKAPLIRAALLKLKENKYLLMIDKHHIISDGVSGSIIMREFANLYVGQKLKAVELQYKDYAYWQQSEETKEQLKEQEKFWLDKFADEVPALNLPTDFIREENQSTKGSSYNFSISKELTKKINDLAKSEETTLFPVLTLAYMILLGKYSNQNDITVGTPISGRKYTEVQNIIGMFVNTLAIREQINRNASFKDMLDKMKKTTFDAFQNQEYQFDQLVDKLNIKRNLNRNPLFDVMISLQNIDIDNISVNGLDIKTYHYKLNTTKFDLNLTIFKDSDEFKFTMIYNTGLFKEATIQRFADSFVRILEDITANRDVLISDINILPAEKKETILSGFNNTQKSFELMSFDKYIYNFANSNSKNTALVYKDRKLTYGELNSLTNKLAGKCREMIGEGNKKIAIYMDQSDKYIISMIAALKAGAAFIPLNIENPLDRIKNILNESNVGLVLTDDQDLEEYRTLNINDSSIASMNDKDLDIHISLDDTAYIIFTSGTTGKPKGVCVSYANLANYTEWFMDTAKLTKEDKSLVTSSVSFDLAYTSVFPALRAGCEVHLCDKFDYMSAKNVLNYINEKGITYLKMTPSLFGHIINDESFGSVNLDKLRLVVLGGEKINIKDVLRAKEVYKNIKVINHYGPTETTIGCIYNEVDTDNLDMRDSYTIIGKPIANNKVFILDENLNPVPVGVIGKIYVSGFGVTKGYLDNEELTKEKYIPSIIDENRVMYDTGDLGIWTEAGFIRYVSRTDNQVKIRGYRVEIDSIEKQIMSLDNVERVVVCDREDTQKNKYLVAFVMCKEDVDFSEIRKHLLSSLPEYMVPNLFVQVENIKLNSNGKIERNVYKTMDIEIKEHNFTEPENVIERSIHDIWCELLGKEKCSITDNFFEIGGNSLLGTSLISKLNKKFEVTIPLKELFSSQTIKDMAQVVKQFTNDGKLVEDENLILLSKGNDKNKNLFLIHAGSGEVGIYSKFASKLDQSFNYWGICCYRERVYGPQNYSIEDIAADYIQKICKVQPEGSYYIAGWCIGGTIAYEIASQLIEMGKDVRFLSLINSIAPQRDYWRGLEPFTVEFEQNNIRKIWGKEGVESVIDDCTTLESLWGNVANYFEENNLDVGIIKRGISERRAKAIANYDKIGVKDLIYRLNIIRTFANARAFYVPKKKINKLIYFFEAKDSGTFNKELWSNFSEKEVIYDGVKGDHFTIFDANHVDEIVRKFGEALKKSN